MNYFVAAFLFLSTVFSPVDAAPSAAKTARVRFLLPQGMGFIRTVLVDDAAVDAHAVENSITREFVVDAGMRVFSFKDWNAPRIRSTPLLIEAGHRYTLAVSGGSDLDEPGHEKAERCCVTLLDDSLSKPPRGQAFIRLVSVEADKKGMPAVYQLRNAAGRVIIDNAAAFQARSTWLPSRKVYRLCPTDVACFPGLALRDQGRYTVWIWNEWGAIEDTDAGKIVAVAPGRGGFSGDWFWGKHPALPIPQALIDEGVTPDSWADSFSMTIIQRGNMVTGTSFANTNNYRRIGYNCFTGVISGNTAVLRTTDRLPELTTSWTLTRVANALIWTNHYTGSYGNAPSPHGFLLLSVVLSQTHAVPTPGNDDYVPYDGCFDRNH